MQEKTLFSYSLVAGKRNQPGIECPEWCPGLALRKQSGGLKMFHTHTKREIIKWSQLLCVASTANSHFWDDVSGLNAPELVSRNLGLLCLGRAPNWKSFWFALHLGIGANKWAGIDMQMALDSKLSWHQLANWADCVVNYFAASRCAQVTWCLAPHEADARLLFIQIRVVVGWDGVLGFEHFMPCLIQRRAGGLHIINA